MKNSNEKSRVNIHQLQKKLLEEAPPKTVLIPSIKDDIKRNKRTKKGQKDTAASASADT
jgi:hypothetical protein